MSDTRVVKSISHGWKRQKYEIGVIKRLAKRTEKINSAAEVLAVLEKKCVTKILGMQETRKIFWHYLVRISEDRCFLALACVFFIKRDDFPVSGSVQPSFFSIATS